ncbi:MAG: thiamine diphosphokinase [Bacillaceae bacterium]|nr:thiamine diphosphokinase [Bacillaceae bacterium]
MSENRRILLFSGGELGDWALRHIEDDDRLVGVDRGTLFLISRGIQPDFAMGDFDSVTPRELEEIRRACPRFDCVDPIDKDHSDTELALMWAIEQKPEEILLLGVLGSRFDHSLANIQLLIRALKAGIPARILGENNEMMLVDRVAELAYDPHFSHVSLLPFTEQVTGITLEGFQYPLHDATLSMGESRGISNVLQEETGKIHVKSGILLVIKSKD